MPPEISLALFARQGPACRWASTGLLGLGRSRSRLCLGRSSHKRDHQPFKFVIVVRRAWGRMTRGVQESGAPGVKGGGHAAMCDDCLTIPPQAKQGKQRGGNKQTNRRLCSSSCVFATSGRGVACVWSQQLRADIGLFDARAAPIFCPFAPLRPCCVFLNRTPAARLCYLLECFGTPPQESNCCGPR